MKGEKNYRISLKYGMLFGFVGFTLTLIGMYLAMGILAPRFPAVIGTGLFSEGFLSSLIKSKRLYKGEGRKASHRSLH